ncbi:MAG: hypothetical protein CVV16_14550 [Gammaproteobacteria bacterium HGW-Gammaproteobacteria-6]|nr:MAG: hypothetical protein CVV16_14550 [Gammaproteobacteria bacterium HGW-Gammaproteobacteria-6]
MQIAHEPLEFRYVLRGVSREGVLLNERVLGSSFILSPSQLIETWSVSESAPLQAGDLEPLLALQPELIVIGTGAQLRFPVPAVHAAALTRGIGIEFMDNAAAARTFNLLASEHRRVVAGFVVGI